MLHYDLAIAGAGPAGSTLALLAARAGCRVLLAERSRFETPRIGETAPPGLRPLLSKVGIDHVLTDATHTAAPAVVSVWGADQPVERHHILSPYGNALHLDRRAFDEAMALAAREAGADLRLGTSIRFRPKQPTGYRLTLSDGSSMQADIAVRANGRAGSGLGLAGARDYLDDNIAAVARFMVPHTREPRTVIEAIAGGWFYLAAIPGNELVAVFMTGADMVPSDRTQRLRWWLQALARTRLVRAALSGEPIPQSLAIYDARSSYLRTSAGPNWFALGDARLAPDPLSGQGIIWAVEDAIFAAELLKDGADLARVIAQHTQTEVADYLAVRDRVYGMERRFPDDPYWLARLRRSPGEPWQRAS